MAKELEEQYDEYNKKYFRGRLPKIPVRWSKDLRCPDTGKTIDGCTPHYYEGGRVTPSCILINADLKKRSVHWRMTLLHEQVHVKLPYPKKPRPNERDFHGTAFQKEMLRLAARGAFRDLW